mmetsp:Transcript_17552/g.39671  ORF Transcript_17552/g.39671 Transcript_17552/m.39671 type:complete len:92 (+) Transcript_17552:7640-7915(+)
MTSTATANPNRTSKDDQPLCQEEKMEQIHLNKGLLCGVPHYVLLIEKFFYELHYFRVSFFVTEERYNFFEITPHNAYFCLMLELFAIYSLC